MTRYVKYHDKSTENVLWKSPKKKPYLSKRGSAREALKKGQIKGHSSIVLGSFGDAQVAKA